MKSLLYLILFSALFIPTQLTAQCSLISIPLDGLNMKGLPFSTVSCNTSGTYSIRMAGNSYISTIQVQIPKSKTTQICPDHLVLSFSDGTEFSLRVVHQDCEQGYYTFGHTSRLLRYLEYQLVGVQLLNKAEDQQLPIPVSDRTVLVRQYECLAQ